jgi:hypothetical protein
MESFDVVAEETLPRASFADTLFLVGGEGGEATLELSTLKLRM